MKHIPISQVDALFASGIYPIEFIFYYQNPFKTKRLRAALKTLSPLFWPLFGEYRDGVIFSKPYREQDHYAEEDLDQEIDLPLVVEKGYGAYSCFKLPDLKSLFFLKVIRLKNGLMIIPKMSHLAGDGYSYFYFLSLLATLSLPRYVPFRSYFIARSFKPHHRRTELRDFAFSGLGRSAAPPREDVTVEKEHMSRGDVQALIDSAAHSAERRVSANDVISAWAVKKLVGKQAAFREDDVGLTIPIDVRRRVKEFGPRFFGNGIWLYTLKLRRSDIQRSSLTDIAVQIRRSMPTPTKETYLDYLQGIEKSISARKREVLRPFDPAGGCLVTNLSKMPADQLNFGAGAPDGILPLTTGKNSAAILADIDRYIILYAY